MSFLRRISVARCVRWLGARSVHSKTPLLSTLNPLALQPSDYLDLSGDQYHTVAFTAAPDGKNPQITYRQTLNGHEPFPPHTAGFLYFHRVPDAAPLEGSLRFRLCANHLPASFEAGRDLLLATGVPWQFIIPQLLQSQLWKVGAQLLRENLITATQVSRCKKVFGSRRSIVPSFTLFRLGQEFSVDFGTDPTLHIIAESPWRIRLDPFAVMKTAPNRHLIRPFTGSGLARFEPSVVDGRRVLHLRITKIITPVVCPNPEHLGLIVAPKEGELLTVTPWHGAPRPWEVDIDRDTRRAAALGALWPTGGIP
ncbi:hypothetical protein C8R46DRAFT_1059974 [Mycena filopes]|nr:hypothetical protein C8R46DRAFT_1059974 [Mycena filopes]